LDQPIYGLEARGLDGQSPGRTRIEEMAADYIREIRSLQPEGPYYLGGFCFGGIIAFEMARQLHEAGQKVAMLALFDTVIGQARRRQPVRWLLKRLRFHLATFTRLPGRERTAHTRWLTREVGKRLNRRLWTIAHRTYQRMGHPLPPTLRNLQMVNRQALLEFAPRPYPGRVTLFWAQDRSESSDCDPAVAWARWATGGVEVHEVPGGHDAIVKEPYVQILAEKLRICLERAQAEANGKVEK
jgi:thioesterase domain-containing protein